LIIWAAWDQGVPVTLKVPISMNPLVPVYRWTHSTSYIFVIFLNFLTSDKRIHSTSCLVDLHMHICTCTIHVHAPCGTAID
jgi:hypothetical protein